MRPFCTLGGKMQSGDVAFQPSSCVRCLIGESSTKCKGCENGLIDCYSRVNWENYESVWRAINDVPRGQGDLFRSLHGRLEDAAILYSVDSSVQKKGMYLIVDDQGLAQNPVGEGALLLFLHYSDVEGWMALQKKLGRDTTGWHVYTW